MKTIENTKLYKQNKYNLRGAAEKPPGFVKLINTNRRGISATPCIQLNFILDLDCDAMSCTY